MKVFLIRHAQCEGNVVEEDARRRMTRAEFNAFLRQAPESPLTALGCQQATEVARAFQGIALGRIYTSPLPRALATARTLGEAQGLAPIVLPALRELMPPTLREYGGAVRLRLLFGHAFTRMLLSPSSPDHLPAALRRARAAWREITAEPAEALAVVSHGWLLGTLLFSLSLDRRWRILTGDLRNGGVSVVLRR